MRSNLFDGYMFLDYNLGEVFDPQYATYLFVRNKSGCENIKKFYYCYKNERLGNLIKSLNGFNHCDNSWYMYNISTCKQADHEFLRVICEKFGYVG